MNTFVSPHLATERLELRELTSADADRVRELVSLAQPEALPPGSPADPGLVADWLAERLPAHRLNGDGVHLVMLDRASGDIVGAIGLFHVDWEVRSTEVGYGVRSDQRGKGHATEALAAVSRWVLTEGGMQRIWLTANTDNLASVRVAEKSGFRREGTLRRSGLEADGLHDQALFSLLDDEI